MGHQSSAETKVIHYLFKGLQAARGRAFCSHSGLQFLNTLFNVIRSLYVKHLFKTYNQTISPLLGVSSSISYNFFLFAGEIIVFVGWAGSVPRRRGAAPAINSKAHLSQLKEEWRSRRHMLPWTTQNIGAPEKLRPRQNDRDQARQALIQA